MIQPTELRINNWVYSIQLAKEVQISSIDNENVSFINEVTWDYNEPDTIEPIVLSEEVLLKCGFELNEDKTLFVIKNCGLRLMDIASSYYRANFPIKADVIYLHQLQNLYFALTNQELIYKP